jgi:hypothetical protein
MKRADEQEIPDQYEELSKFLDLVFQKDQSDPQRSNAPICYEMLINRQNEFIGTPLEKAFWNAVSLEAFHMAQSEAMEGHIENTLRNLEIACEASHKGIRKEWEAYVKGTYCYFKDDIEGLKREIPNAGGNKDTLQRLLNGYMARGGINYKEDY